MFTDNDITTVHTFLMLSQEMVMSTLQMKLGSWLRIQRLQQEFRESGILSEVHMLTKQSILL